MARRLENTVALVTGASSGIGAATAVALAEEGAAVSLVARREERLRQLAKRIEDAGGKAIVIATDITDEALAKEAVERTVGELGRLDVVVNNAGVMYLGAIEGAPIEEWKRMVELNMLGLLYITHAALPHLLRAAEDSPRRVADIVNISSVAGRRSRLGTGVYSMTKFGVVGLTEALRQEVTGRHVRVSVVEPGAVDTELSLHTREEARKFSARASATFEVLQPEDIADNIVYIVTRPRRVAINELMVRPTEQSS